MTPPRLSFCGGKGGVGKTTCAAAAAVRAASEGSRVLVVSTDPAHSLADALAVELGPDARRVHGARGELYATELDADRALGRWLRVRDQAFHTIASRGTYLDDEDIDRMLSLSFPGVDELVGLIELLRLAKAHPYDEVIVDTAPTGHTLRLLEMPETLARLAQVLNDMHEKHRFLTTSLGGAWAPDAADEVIDDIAREAAELHAILTDRSRASFTWVTLPEELPVRESEDAAEAMAELGIALAVVVVNRVWPVPDRPCARCTPRVSEERTWRLYLARTFAGARVIEMPALLVEPRGPRALLELALAARDAEEPPTPPSGPAPGAAAKSARGFCLPISPSAELVLFGGKGGVGKTSAATAAALALAEERPRDRVLVLSTDPAHSLGDAFAAELSDDEQPVPGAPPNLVARELDAARAWASQRERYRSAIDDLFSSIFRGNMSASYDRIVLEDLLDLAPPGIDELLALVTITEALSPPARYDLVIADTAPTGHTLRLLELPAKALEWVHALMVVVLKYRNVVGLGDFASDLTDFAHQLRGLMALLTDPTRAAFVAVTRPAILPRLETARLVRKLKELEVPLAAILVNAVTEPGCGRCNAAVEVERSELVELSKLAVSQTRSKQLVKARAIYPGPRGANALARWGSAWFTDPRGSF
ncbi:ArsA family ATPase [Labilithrix luteola]|uniref:ArsA family ATPase n=1 Tax=Labilithrix luteola TaxID=1391654 RepID=UPI001969DB80|nr:TRC40/GET3/ArsA family transport-energizing ATPase [Labilithrix luteola]